MMIFRVHNKAAKKIWLVGCLGFNGLLRQYFSIYRAVSQRGMVGWLVVLGLTVLLDNISVYVGPSPKKRDKEEK